ncbi:MAG TPA: hypothetical protein VMT30_06820 [Candidatus Saccharimonadia bacterium]|nr:hypothetical protein [Candidatus Saccharimonadia bacterium]
MSIVLVSLMVAIMRNLKRISERAESATSSVANLAETFGRKLGPLAASGILGMLIKRFTSKRASKED